MLRHVALVSTGVLEKLSVSFIRLIRIGELGTTPAVTSNRRTLRRSTISVDEIRMNSVNLFEYRRHLNGGIIYTGSVTTCIYSFVGSI
jgi:hypothetical protein